MIWIKIFTAPEYLHPPAHSEFTDDQNHLLTHVFSRLDSEILRDWVRHVLGSRSRGPQHGAWLRVGFRNELIVKNDDPEILSVSHSSKKCVNSSKCHVY